MGRLIVVSNRVGLGRRRGGVDGRAGRGAGRGAARIHRPVVRLERRDRRRHFTGEIAHRSRSAASPRHHRPRGAGPRRILQRLRQRTLWPLFHYRLDLADFDRRFGAGYERVNQLFAAQARAADRAGRHHLGARLSPDPAGARAARARLQEPHRLLPAHPLAAAADPRRHARATTAGARAVRLRPGRLPEPSDLRALRALCRARGARRSCVEPTAAGARSAAPCRPGAFPIGIDVEEFDALAHAPEAREMLRAHAARVLRAAS